MAINNMVSIRIYVNYRDNEGFDKMIPIETDNFDMAIQRLGGVQRKIEKENKDIIADDNQE